MGEGVTPARLWSLLNQEKGVKRDGPLFGRWFRLGGGLPLEITKPKSTIRRSFTPPLLPCANTPLVAFSIREHHPRCLGDTGGLRTVPIRRDHPRSAAIATARAPTTRAGSGTTAACTRHGIDDGIAVDSRHANNIEFFRSLQLLPQCRS